jgi:dephospho-CoA kinase
MKKTILISGIAGSGKSFIAKYFKKIGIESYDIENYGNLFKMYKKDTGKVFINYDNRNIKHVKNSEWICDLNLLKKLIKN